MSNSPQKRHLAERGSSATKRRRFAYACSHCGVEGHYASTCPASPFSCRIGLCRYVHESYLEVACSWEGAWQPHLALRTVLESTLRQVISALVNQGLVACGLAVSVCNLAHGVRDVGCHLELQRIVSRDVDYVFPPFCSPYAWDWPERIDNLVTDVRRLAESLDRLYAEESGAARAFLTLCLRDGRGRPLFPENPFAGASEDLLMRELLPAISPLCYERFALHRCRVVHGF